MKKLSILVMLMLTVNAFGQDLSGINEEHLTWYGATKVTPSNHLRAKKILLKSGVELEYVEQGDPNGVPVIFLHGLSDSWHSFETTLQQLPFSIHAFALSQRGHGNSQKPEKGYTPKDFAADVAAFIQQKNLSTAVIVGHSMGGVVTQQFVISYPELARGMVIVGSDPAAGNNPGMPEFLQDVLNMSGSFSREFMIAFQSATLARPIDSNYFNLLVDEGMKCPLSVFKAALTALTDVNFTPSLKAINIPTAIFWGEKDAFFLRKGQDVLAAEIKESEFTIYEGTGHALHWEQPERFAKDLTAFIQKHAENIKNK